MDLPFLKKKKKNEEVEPAHIEKPLPDELERFRIERDFGEPMGLRPLRELARETVERREPRTPEKTHHSMSEDQKIELILQKLETIDARLKLIEQRLERV